MKYQKQTKVVKKKQTKVVEFIGFEKKKKTGGPACGRHGLFLKTSRKP